MKKAEDVKSAEPTDDGMRHRILGKCHDLLVTKASAVVVGILLKNLLAHTAKFFLFGTAPSVGAESPGMPLSSDKASLELLVAVCLFALMLSSAVGAKIGVSHLSIPESLKKTYSAGLSLIPAWAWKDVVVALLTVCKHLGWVGKDSQSLCIMALAVALLSSLLQILLEYLDSGRAKESFFSLVVNVFKVSLGLGVAFTVNLCYQTLLSDDLKATIYLYIAVQLGYCSLLTILVALAQVKGGEALADKELTLLVRTVKFLLTAGNFVVAFAWKGLVMTVLSACIGDAVETKALAYLVSAIVVTFLGIGCIVASAALNMRKSISGLCILAVGMNIGWAWAGFATVSMVSGEPIAIGHLWLYTIIATAIVCTIAVGVDRGVVLLDKPSEEARPLLPADKA